MQKGIELFHELIRRKLCAINGSQGTNMKMVAALLIKNSQDNLSKKHFIACVWENMPHR